MVWNPFNWTAGPFITLYLALAFTTFWLSFRLKSEIGPSAQASGRLGILELAYLAGGAKRLGDAVLFRLTSENGAIIEPDGRNITVVDQVPLASLIGKPPRMQLQPDMTRQQFQTAIQPIVERIQERLQRSGYCPSREQMASFRKTVLPFVGLLMVFGLTKAVVGASRHHPVDFLLFLILVTAVAGLVLATTPRRTRAGTNVLESYQASHERASRAPLDHELLLAVALTGAVVLTGTAHASVYSASQTMSSGDSGGGGCGGGGGGGGGGCGGCS
ncbi:TIGR04222 domain-containing membrane protein [Bradyrhizobium sp. Y36]|uniref:TIGR04222 domain-containing membrane protein n=1 Tax=Bradyrhizobium sp. Y36 TaxID=2035447 RepID=UPI000BEA061B|nr:TIGR04222 domain-containing membrane protein [Bradyrhizobium sp. Y36]PDT92228.1 TIGR04222 domain-containing membrane protein [Bradyrhizobium sp. Y36]